MKFSIKIHKRLEKKLMKDWESLWKESKEAHIFNSPYWYKACLNSIESKEILIISCYTLDSNPKLVAILPLVRGAKFKQKIYLSPGGKYLDKSTLLINEDSDQKLVLEEITKTLKKVGSFYLTELTENEINLTSELKGLYTSISSFSLKLPVKDDPFRFVGSEKKRRIRKSIKDNRENLNFKFGSENLNQSIKIARKIEQKSLKTEKSIDIFSDNFLVNLCFNLDKLLPNVLFFSFLYFKNKPICYKYGYIFKNHYHYCNTAYDLNYKRLSPGKLLMYLTIENLSNKNVDNIDFSRGNTQFKRDFTSISYKQYSLFYIQNPIVMFIWRIMYSLRSLIYNEQNL